MELEKTGHRSYSGTWRESAQRFGTLQITLSADAKRLTGSFQTDPKGELGDSTVRSIDWRRLR